MIKTAAPTDYDIVVVGSGIAGLSAALTAAASARVAVVTKGALDDGCSRFAQGGIAAAVGDDDLGVAFRRIRSKRGVDCAMRMRYACSSRKDRHASAS